MTPSVSGQKHLGWVSVHEPTSVVLTLTTLWPRSLTIIWSVTQDAHAYVYNTTVSKDKA